MAEELSTTPVPLQGPPYPVPVALLGLDPVPGIDDPICGVFLAIYLSLAACHMTIHQLNLRRGHKFLFSGALFGLSMARTTAMVMRIVWASYPNNTRIALASNIITQAGVLILIVINLFLASRIVRAYLPTVGWHPVGRFLLAYSVTSSLLNLGMLIVVVIHSSYTLDQHAIDIDHKVTVVASTYFAVMAFLPTATSLSSVLISRYRRSMNPAPSSTPSENKHRRYFSSSDTDDKEKEALGPDEPPPPPTQGSAPVRPEKFGSGSLRTKVVLLCFTSCIITAGAIFRTYVNFNPRPASHPAWFHSRECFYCFNFVIEVTVSALYFGMRVDLRFHVPNGSKGPGDYSAGQQKERHEAHGTPSAQLERGVHSVGPTFSRNANRRVSGLWAFGSRQG